jgi:hypothetical protein
MLDESEMRLESLRDAGLPTFTYFYTQYSKVVSPYFNSIDEAKEWLTHNDFIQKINDNS